MAKLTTPGDSLAISVVRRFWANVQKSDGCWEWCGPRTSSWGPYGAFNWKPDGKKNRQERAHRFAWMATYSAIPHGLFVLHRCDNPLCVNPAHLFLGTGADNMADKCRKGRQTKGSEFPTSRLDEGKVARIIGLCKSGKTHAAVANMFGVTRETVTYIMMGKTWKHVDRSRAALSLVAEV